MKWVGRDYNLSLPISDSVTGIIIGRIGSWKLPYAIFECESEKSANAKKRAKKKTTLGSGLEGGG
jgi:hypothetical protein